MHQIFLVGFFLGIFKNSLLQIQLKFQVKCREVVTLSAYQDSLV